MAFWCSLALRLASICVNRSHGSSTSVPRRANRADTLFMPSLRRLSLTHRHRNVGQRCVGQFAVVGEVMPSATTGDGQHDVVHRRATEAPDPLKSDSSMSFSAIVRWPVMFVVEGRCAAQ